MDTLNTSKTDVEKDQRQQVRKSLVKGAVQKWIDASIDLSGRNTLLYLRELRRGTLRLDDAVESQLRSLLAGRQVKLSKLFADSDTFDDAVKRCRTIRKASQHYQEERGLETLKLAVGLGSWPSNKTSKDPNAPILLRSLEMIPQGRLAEDFNLRLGDEWETNPTLIRALASEFDVNIGAGEKLRDLIESENGASQLDAVFDEITLEAADVPGFEISSGFVAGNFTFAKAAQAEVLEQAEDSIADHALLSAIAGDADAIAEVLEKAQRLAADNPIDSLDPENEFLILDADHSQSYVINAALRGADQVVIGPPGTGKSQTIANMLASLAAQGKKALFVAEKRAAIDAVIKRLESVGLDDLVLDLHEGASARRRVAQDLNNALQNARNAVLPDNERLHMELRNQRDSLNGYANALHKKRTPWDVSLLEAEAGTIDPELPRLNSYHLERSLLEEWDSERFDEMEASISSFGLAGGIELWGDEERGWSEAYREGSIGDEDDASRATDLLRSIQESLLPSLRQIGFNILRPMSLPEPIDLTEARQLSALLDEQKMWHQTFKRSAMSTDRARLIKSLSRPKFGVLGRVFAGATDHEFKAALADARALTRDGVSRRASSLLRNLERFDSFLVEWETKTSTNPL